jgi:hypothetical protein
VRIQLAHHLNVAPDWFDDKPPIWQDWALASLNITRAVERGPQQVTANGSR